ncbi:MAG TPA: FAD-dependent oxidoreductase, partial [Pirellulales bacterium]|nr:FAD-dependent oxidoreductase [Pirellulales bacterium]
MSQATVHVQPSTVPYDVVIVGAGLAGLCAARQLVLRGANCILLEARDRVGGRMLSQPLAGETIDLGGQWIGPTQNRLAALANELGVRRFAQYSTGRKLLSWAGKLTTYSGDLPRLSLFAQLELLLADRRLKSFVREIPPEAPWRAPRAGQWDSITLETWKRRHMRTGGARLFLDIVTRAVLTSEPRDVSFLFFLSYLRWGQGLERLISIEGGAQQERFVGGAQQLAIRLADELAPRVINGAAVRSIEQDAEWVTIRSDAGAYQARLAIVAVPPVLAGRIHYSPSLPAKRDQLTARMPMGSVIKYVAAYERPFWREAGFSGEAFSDTGITVTTFDDTSHDGAHPALVTFSDGQVA